MIWFKNIFRYAGWNSLHIPNEISKLSGLNVFRPICLYIGCGRHRTIKCLTNQINRSEHYNRLSCLPVNICTLFVQTWYLISAVHYVIADWAGIIGSIILIFCTLYKFSHRWMRHEVIWHRYIQSIQYICSMIMQGRWDLAFKASLLLLAFLKSPTLPLKLNKWISQEQCVNLYLSFVVWFTLTTQTAAGIWGCCHVKTYGFNILTRIWFSVSCLHSLKT